MTWTEESVQNRMEAVLKYTIRVGLICSKEGVLASTTGRRDPGPLHAKRSQSAPSSSIDIVTLRLFHHILTSSLPKPTSTIWPQVPPFHSGARYDFSSTAIVTAATVASTPSSSRTPQVCRPAFMASSLNRSHTSFRTPIIITRRRRAVAQRLLVWWIRTREQVCVDAAKYLRPVLALSLGVAALFKLSHVLSASFCPLTALACGSVSLLHS